MIYVLTHDIEESDDIRRYRNYPLDEWVFIDTPTFNMKNRDGRGKVIYFCGTFHERPDWQEIEYRAQDRGFEVRKEMPPRYEK